MVRFDPFPSLPNKKTHVFPHMSLFVFSYPADDGQPVRSGFWGDDYVEIFAFSPLFGRKTTPFGEVLKGRGIFVCEANFRGDSFDTLSFPPGEQIDRMAEVVVWQFDNCIGGDEINRCLVIDIRRDWFQYPALI